MVNFTEKVGACTFSVYQTLSLSLKGPGDEAMSLPVFNVACKKPENLVREITCVTTLHITPQGPKVALWSCPFSSYRFWKGGLLVHYLLVRWLCYDRLYVLEPYLWPATNGSTYKTADLYPTLASRPSVYLWCCASDFAYQALPFFACNIKNWEWPRDEASYDIGSC